MSAGYLGGGRECGSTYYRPGMGWSQLAVRRRRRRFKPSNPRGLAHAHVSPLTISAPQRPGLVARVIIVAVVVLVVFALILTLQGAHGFIV